MSLEAMSRVLATTGITAEEKLMLLWLADNTTDFGCAVMVDPHGMGQFICADHHQAMAVLTSLEGKGLILWGNDEDETSSYLWLTHEGESYDPPIDWTGEAKSRNRRVAALIERDGAGCSYCGCTPLAYEVDHFIPRAKGGEDKMANLVLACKACNRAKRDKWPQDFLADRADLYRALSSNLRCLHS